EYQSRRDLVVRELQGISGICPLIPDAGLFVMIDLRELLGDAAQPRFTSNDVRRFLLEEHGLVVIHGSAYGKRGEGVLRISFAAGGTALERGVALLRTGLSQVASAQWQWRRA